MKAARVASNSLRATINTSHAFEYEFPFCLTDWISCELFSEISGFLKDTRMLLMTKTAAYQWTRFV